MKVKISNICKTTTLPPRMTTTFPPAHPEMIIILRKTQCHTKKWKSKYLANMEVRNEMGKVVKVISRVKK